MMKRIAQWAVVALSLILIVLACSKDDDSGAKAPNITSHTESGPVGSTLIINGTNFGASIAENTVTLNGVAVSLSDAKTTKLTGEVPANATTGKIKVTTAGGSDTSDNDFEVTIPDENTTLSLNKTTLTLYPYEHYIETLEATTNVESPTISWMSSDTDVATVDENGEVTPLTLGTTTITASLNGVTAECVITVADGPVTELTLNNSTLELYTDETAQLSIATLMAADVESTGAAQWSSDNETAVTVDADGNIEAKGAGTANVTLTVDNATATCTVTVRPNVYVAGKQLIDGVEIATYWKNGAATKLSGPPFDAVATGIFVQGPDIYVSAYVNNNNHNQAIRWKNGNILHLSENGKEAKANGIFVDDTGIEYVVGYHEQDGYNVASIWVDEIFGTFGTSGSNSAANSIFIDSSSKTYAAGFQEEGQGDYNNAQLWEGANTHSLADTDFVSTANAVVANGTNYYVVGAETGINESQAMLWTNNLEIKITDGNIQAEAYGVAAADGFVYVVGREFDQISKPMLWVVLNGTVVNAVPLSQGPESYVARSIQISGSDIYVAGTKFGENQDAIVWKINEDGIEEAILPAEGDAYGYDIFVK